MDSRVFLILAIATWMDDLYQAYLSKSKEYRKRGAEEDYCAHDIRHRVWEFLEPNNISEEARITPCWVCQQSAKNWPDNYPNIEAHWEQQEGSRLISFS